MKRFDGRVVMITGAARGQGREHAVAFAREGADIIICDVCQDVASAPYPLASARDLDETAAMVEALGRRCIAEIVDVRSTEQLASLVHRGESEFGGIDTLLANAGICGFGPFAEITDEMWDDMINIDLTGVFKSIRAVVPGMRARRRGRIIATSSMGGRRGIPHLAHYVAAKWGVIGLVKSLALEIADCGITANVVCPTTVDTPMVHNPAMYSLFCPDIDSPNRLNVEGIYSTMNPMTTPWIRPEEVSDLMLFLASAQADSITGSVFEISLGGSALMN